MKFDNLIESFLRENQETVKKRNQDDIKKDFESLYAVFEGYPRTSKQAEEMGWKIFRNYGADKEEVICEQPNTNNSLTIDGRNYEIEIFKNDERIMLAYNDRNDPAFVPAFEIVHDKLLKISNKKVDDSDSDIFKTLGDRLFHIIEFFESRNKYREKWATRIDGKTEYFKEIPWWLEQGRKEKAERIGLDFNPLSKTEEEY